MNSCPYFLKTLATENMAQCDAWLNNKTFFNRVAGKSDDYACMPKLCSDPD